MHKVNLKIQYVYSLIQMHSNVFIDMAVTNIGYEAYWGLWVSKFFKCSVDLNCISGANVLNRQTRSLELNV